MSLSGSSADFLGGQDVVVHEDTSVTTNAHGEKVCTNTVEAFHSAVKQNARAAHLWKRRCKDETESSWHIC